MGRQALNPIEAMPENPYRSPTYTVPCAVCGLDKIQVLDPISIVFDMICEDCYIEYQETLAGKTQALNPPQPCKLNSQ